MASLKQIRTRLKSIGATQKITSAMKLVAAAKLKRSQILVEGGNLYVEQIKKTGARIFPFYKELDNAHIFIKMNDGDKFYVVFLADKGLCGGFNSNILRLTRKTFSDHIKKKESFKFCVVGKKGADRLAKDFEKQYIQAPEVSLKSDESVQEFCQFIEKLAEDKAVGSAYFISSFFKNMLVQDIKIKQYLPLRIVEETDDVNPPFFEPSQGQLNNQFTYGYFKSMFFQVLLNQATSEHAAKMTAMDSATRNAKDMIKSLRIVYNRTRQACITAELTELISGAQALEEN